MQPVKLLKLSVQPDEQSEFDKDIWDGHKLGADIRPSDRRTINFSTISPLWLRQAAKHYIRYTFSTLSWASCREKKRAIGYFSSFLAKNRTECLASDINRSLIIEFLGYLVSKKLSEKTRLDILVHLNTFFTLCSRNGWEDVGDKALIYKEDYPQLKKPIPRYIPQEVLDQLNRHQDSLPESVMRMVLVLQECGMRLGELLLLPFNCLIQDGLGDWFLRYYQSKMKKEITIPISRELVVVIQEQQKYIRDNIGAEFQYLFCANRGTHGKFVASQKPMSAGPFSRYLNRVSENNNICDLSGKLWRFQAHQFRHTVGTRMINSGVPHHIIQRYLGHESSNMTARYAHIFDSTLKKEIANFHGKVVNVAGQIVESEHPELDASDLQWFKRSIQAQALPNGSCALPTIMQGCPHANACLTCTHFRTTSEFLSEHQVQLEQTEKIIEKAQANGWHRQMEMNEKVATNLRSIIKSLEEQDAPA